MYEVRKRAEKMNLLLLLGQVMLRMKARKKRSHTAKAKYYLRQRPTKKKSYGNGQVVLTAKARIQKNKKKEENLCLRQRPP